MASLQIRLLGPFEVTRAGQALSHRGWRSRQTRTLLKILLTPRQRVITAEQFIEHLWARSNPAAARRSVHVRMSQLRRALDPDNPQAFIVTTRQGYVFQANAPCWIDVVSFEAQQERGLRALENRDLVEAVTAFETAHSLYRGDLLEADRYEEWSIAERERLREKYLSLLLALASAYACMGRFPRAIQFCQDALAREPYREAVYAHLMAFYYFAGDRSMALRIYARCGDMLASELNLPPLAATRALAAQIRAGCLKPEALHGRPESESQMGYSALLAPAQLAYLP